MIWLKVIFAVEAAGLIGGVTLFAFWKRSSQDPRRWVIVLALLLLVPAASVLAARDDSGLYALTLVPLVVILAPFAIVLPLVVAALVVTDRRENRERERSV